MRIAIIAPFGMQPKGTVSARIVPLAHALAHRGHSVRVVVPPWDDPSARALKLPKHEFTVTGPAAGVHIVTLALPRRAPYSLALTAPLVREALLPTGKGLPRGMSAQERALAGFRPQVVHVSKPVGYSGLAGLALKGLGVPWVLDTDDWEGAGGWADANPYSPLQRLLATAQDALMPRLAGAVTAASRTLEARLWSFGVGPKRVFYMPNGVWREKYGDWHSHAHSEALEPLKQRYGLSGKPVLLLYTRFAEFPFDFPLEVLRRVQARVPDTCLLVVGSGFFGEEHELVRKAESMGLGGSVVTTGRVAEVDLPAHLGMGDVALYPMLDTLLNRAKSPVKVLEPMLAGVPLVVSRVGEAAAFVGPTGIQVEPGDADATADAVTALLENPAERARLSAEARERVWSLYNWETLSAQSERAYESVLGAGASRRTGGNAVVAGQQPAQSQRRQRARR